MDARDGFSTTKNPGSMLVVPYEHSAWTTEQERQHQKHDVTREPDTWKLVSPVRREGVEKGHLMHLVGVLLHHWAHRKRAANRLGPTPRLGQRKRRLRTPVH